MGSSWDGNLKIGGASWSVRDAKGLPLYHSRRSFSQVGSLTQATLMAISWAAEAMRDLKIMKVIFEVSSLEACQALDYPLRFLGDITSCQHALVALHSVVDGRLNLISVRGNNISNLIAESVTRDKRYPSYVARQGPAWLSSQIYKEATRC